LSPSKVEKSNANAKGCFEPLWKCINLLAIPSSLSRSYSTFPLCSGTTLIEIAVDKRCRWPIAYLAEHKYLQFYILSNCNCSRLIVNKLNSECSLRLNAELCRCLQNVFCEKPAAMNWFGFASLISGTESVVRIRQSPDLLPLFWSIFGSLAFPLYSI
jgi:hypothetical protein